MAATALGVALGLQLRRRPETPGGTGGDPRGLEAAASQLREGEARLEAIVRSAMDAIITIDATYRIVLFNAAAEKMFGCSAAQAIGAPLDRFIPERFHAAHRQHVERFGRTGETSRRMGMQTALWALHADGTEFPIEASISQATVGGQKLLTVILRDITERISAEREIRRAHQELREGESRLEAIVGSAMDGIITSTRDQRIVLFNAAAETDVPVQRRAGDRHARSTASFPSGSARRTRRTSTGSAAPARRRGGWGCRPRCGRCATDGTEFPIEASISQAHRRRPAAAHRDPARHHRAHESRAGSSGAPTRSCASSRSRCTRSARASARASRASSTTSSARRSPR